jgi:hypothetical protein
MTQEEIQAFIVRIASGDIVGATQAVLAKLPDNAAFLQAGRDLEAKGKAFAETNAARVDLMNKAVIAFGEVMLAIALAMVGL